MTRTVEEIRTTGRGPRPIPPVGAAGVLTPPQCIDTVLPNGLRVLLVRQPSVATVQLRMVVPFAGTDPRHPLRAGMVASTLFLGTGRRSRLAVDTDLAAVGGALNTAVDPAHLVIKGSSLASGLPTLLDVTVDALLDAAFRGDEVALAGNVLAQEVAVQRSDPGFLAAEALQRRRFGDHPISRGVTNPVELLTVSPEELHAARRDGLVPRGSTLLLVGDIDLDDTLSEVEHATAAWSSEASAQLLPAIPRIQGGDLRAVPMPGAVQAHLRLSAQTVSITDPQAAPLTLATLALGGGFSARLAELIREKLRYCYSVRAGLEFFIDADGRSGSVAVSMATATATAVPALKALRGELERFCAEPPSGQEVEEKRSFAIGSQFIGAMSQMRLADRLTPLVAQGLTVSHLADHSAALSAATVEEVADQARATFDPSRLTGIVLGDVDALAGPLSEAGGVVFS